MAHGSQHPAGMGYPDPFPITPARVRVLGATLRAGRYRSHANYLNLYVVEAERQGGRDPSAAVRRAVADAKCACGRGLGGPKQSDGIPLELLALMPPGEAPFSPGGPMWPKHAIIMGTLFLTREVELASAVVADISFQQGVANSQ